MATSDLFLSYDIGLLCMLHTKSNSQLFSSAPNAQSFLPSHTRSRLMQRWTTGQRNWSPTQVRQWLDTSSDLSPQSSIELQTLMIGIHICFVNMNIVRWEYSDRDATSYGMRQFHHSVQKWSHNNLYSNIIISCQRLLWCRSRGRTAQMKQLIDWFSFIKTIVITQFNREKVFNS